VAAPVVTGYLVQSTRHYTAALIVAGSIAFVGACTWAMVVPAVRAVEWGTR
jgi:hypothetical protein